MYNVKFLNILYVGNYNFANIIKNKKKKIVFSMINLYVVSWHSTQIKHVVIIIIILLELVVRYKLQGKTRRKTRIRGDLI